MSWWERQFRKVMSGGLQYGFTGTNPVVGDTTLTEDDHHVVIDASSAAVTITLPASPLEGQVYNIACLDSTNLADIDFNGKNFYSSSANESLIAGENLSIIYDGTQWVGA